VELKSRGKSNRDSSRWIGALLATGLLLAAAPSFSQESLTAAYEASLEWRYSDLAIPVPDDGLVVTAGSASWTLESGNLRLSEPVAAGRITGVVFEGRGTFRFAIPDPYELEQLRRFSEMADLEAIELAFDRLILRAGDVASHLNLDSDLEPEMDAVYSQSRLAKERQEHWLEQRLADIDARVIAALARPTDNYLRVEVDTDEFGWLTWERDPARDEAIQLYLYQHHYLETWVSLRREFEGGEADLRSPYDLRHVDIHADLRKAGKHSRQGMSRQHPRAGHFTVELEIEGLHERTLVLPFALDHFAQVKAVRHGERDLDFLRNRIGKGARNILDEVEDDDLLIILEEPLDRGETIRLTIEYEMEVLNYLPGHSWYPAPLELALNDRHTGEIVVELPEKIEVRGMGRPNESIVDKKNKSVSHSWTISEPVRMMTLTFAEKSIEEELVVEGRPTIRVFGSRTRSSPARFREVAVDISNSLKFFENAFGKTDSFSEMQVARISSNHGQAFKGFLQLSEGTFHTESSGPSQLFRAHEVAHQWWGHAVGWASYRDQWLSEALAEYSAMMFVEATMDDGPELFAEMLEVYRQEQLGSLKTAMSRFSRAWMVHLNDTARERMGPIGLGYRAATWDALTGYRSQVYQRGALALHMLRVLMRQASGSDETFLEALADFATTEKGQEVRTQDFQETMERHYPGSLDWFFEQWIAGTAIPSYRWSYGIQGDEKTGFRAIVRVQQEDVPETFRMPIPILFRYEDGSEEEFWGLIDRAQTELGFDLRGKPRDVLFAPNTAVLAKIRQER
jgi:hypothetical protein